MTTCAALLATFFHGVTIADLDRSRVYEVPSSVMASMTMTQRAMAKSCAWRHRIKYRVVD
jgi:hypothetical protein